MYRKKNTKTILTFSIISSSIKFFFVLLLRSTFKRINKEIRTYSKQPTNKLAHNRNYKVLQFNYPQGYLGLT